jgi:hypothetical protein
MGKGDEFEKEETIWRGDLFKDEMLSFRYHKIFGLEMYLSGRV